MKSKKRVSIHKERDVITYAEMWHTSLCLLERGQEQQKASTHQFRASLVFTAFTLEAYLNHIGAQLFDCWEDLERLGPREKLKLIAEYLGISISQGHRPWQVMRKLFSFRNAIAHGKSSKLKPPVKVASVTEEEPPEAWLAMTAWEAFCTEEDALRSREDVQLIVETIYKTAKDKGHETGYPFQRGMQFWSKSLLTKAPPNVRYESPAFGICSRWT